MATTSDEDGQEWTAHFHRHHSPETLECDTPSGAFSFLMWGEERFELSADKITNPDGSTLIEGAELAALINRSNEAAFDEWLSERYAGEQP